MCIQMEQILFPGSMRCEFLGIFLRSILRSEVMQKVVDILIMKKLLASNLGEISYGKI